MTEKISFPLQWWQVAELALAKMGDVLPGRRRAAVVEVADWLQSHDPTLEIAPETLRTAIGAYKFLEEVGKKDQALAMRMRLLPAIAVKWVTGWYRRDPDAAGRAVLDVLDKGLRLKDLRDREMAARQGGPEEGRASLNAAARRWKGSLVLNHDLCWPVEAACISWQPDLGSKPIGRATAVGSLTLALQTSDGGTLPWEPRVKTDIDGKSCGYFPGIGLYLVGPYADAASERGRVANWCLRGLGATFYHDLVALVVRHDTEISRYKALLETKGERRSDRLMILRERKLNTSTSRSA